MRPSIEISGLADVHSQIRTQTQIWTAVSSLAVTLTKIKLVEEGWLPKTSQAEIQLMSLDNQRDVTSLCTILLRRVLKSTPYVEHLTNYQTEKLISSKQGSMVVQGYVYSSRAVVQLQRYLRYLNYVLRKNRVPLVFSEMKSTDVEGMSMKKFVFQCRLSVSYPLAASESNAISVCLPDDVLEERFKTIENRSQEVFGSRDAVYTSRGAVVAEWSLVPVTSVAQLQYNALKTGRDTNSSLCVPEKIVFLLPHILKFAENLTRKLVYGPSAFAVVAKDDTLRNAGSTVPPGEGQSPAAST